MISNERHRTCPLSVSVTAASPPEPSHLSPALRGRGTQAGEATALKLRFLAPAEGGGEVARPQGVTERGLSRSMHLPIGHHHAA